MTSIMPDGEGRIYLLIWRCSRAERGGAQMQHMMRLTGDLTSSCSPDQQLLSWPAAALLTSSGSPDQQLLSWMVY